MYVCVCKGVRFSDVVQAARSCGSSPEDLINAFGFDDDTSCGSCVDHITKLSVKVRLELEKPQLDLVTAGRASKRR